MLVVGHQPQFFPYIGILNKISKADVFVIVDHVQYVRKYFYNRTYLKINGQGQLLTVPVVSKGQYQVAINEVEINRDQFRPEKLLRTLRLGYGKTDNFERYFPQIETIFRGEHRLLSDLTCELLEFIMAEFQLVKEVRYSSELGISGNKTELLVQLTRAVNGNAYLSGEGARDYFDADAFEVAGFSHIFNQFQHPVYPQVGDGFLEGMGCVDLLFNCGPEGRDYIVRPELYLP